jgi:hypothetical protein
VTLATQPRKLNAFLKTLKLESGSHSPDGQYCLLEAVAFVAGEPWSDQPKCVSKVIGAFGRSWNDTLDDAGRQRLKKFIPAMIGTATTSADEMTRAWLATDWLVRTFTPAWLDRAGLHEHAAKLRALDALTSTALARKAQPIIEEARRASAAAGAAARAAAGDAAWDAPGDAARAAARAAAGNAAWDAAWDAPGDAARAAAGDAAWDAPGAAAGAAARAAAGAAAGAAARAAAGDAARAAARAAAGDAARAAAKGKEGYSAQYQAAYVAAKPLVEVALADTISAMQTSAESLLTAMCAVGR